MDLETRVIFCPRCNAILQRRTKPMTAKRLKQPYYFTEWDFCEECGHVQHYEKYKVYTKGMMGSLFDD